MIVRLAVIKGPDAGKVFEIPPGQTRTVGRSSKSDIHIHDIGISRIHCQVRNEGNRSLAEDLNSKNGTIVNGERIIQSAQLQDDDELKIGTTVLKVAIVKDDERTPGSAREAKEVRAEVEAIEERERPPASPGEISSDLGSAVEAADEPGAGPAAKPSDAADALMGAFDSWLDKRQGEQKKPPVATPPEKRPSGKDTDDVLFKLEVEDEPKPLGAAPPKGQRTAAPPHTDQYPRFGGPHPGKDTSAQAVLVEVETAPDPLVGKVIGGCKIEEHIGTDALSKIYRATQLSMERSVKLRVLAEEMTRDAAALQRFVEAARAGGRLMHPNILQVYAAGESDGYWYVALEIAEGITVREILCQGGRVAFMPVDKALDIGIHIAGALSYAHGQNVFHADMSLDNIVVTRHGIAKLADTGFARELAGLGGAGGKAVPRVSQFTAPEQFAGSPGGGPAADVYALGVVMFVMLSGHLPFAARTDAELRAKISAGQHESLQRLRASLPADLCHVIEKTMSPQPEHRYASAGEFQQELSTIRGRLR